jgi:acetyl-CoA C-acetyltransferase
MPVAGHVAIIGSGVTPFGVQHEVGYLDLIRQAVTAALADAELELDQIEAAWLGTSAPLTAALIGDTGAGITQAFPEFDPRPSTRVNAACCTGMESIRGAAMAIAAGEYDVVLAVGAEKMRDVGPRESLVERNTNHTHPTIGKGRTAPGFFALLASRYMSINDCTPEDLAAIAVKNHEHALRNPIAQFAEAVTTEQVLEAPRVAEPLGVLDSTPTTDGAAAVVLTSVQAAERHGRPFAVIEGLGMSYVDGYYSGLFNPKNDFLGFRATRAAAAKAYEQAGITSPREELDVVECHDCFTITEILNYEDLGFCERGGGVDLLRSGATAAGGDLPVNLSGGLQACGHPIGATGVRMVKEIVDQVMDRAGERQVEGASRGLAHTLGGPGMASSVYVISGRGG